MISIFVKLTMDVHALSEGYELDLSGLKTV